jgi:predicted enzyme related to lactoylglutathione lyase
MATPHRQETAMSNGYLHGKFVWFEHMSGDPDRAMKFYDALFGWRSERVPMGSEPYPMIHNGGQAIGGYRKNPAATHWVSYLSVPDVDVSFRGAVAAGAKAVMSPTDFGPAGRAAAIKDPTGTPFALWKDARGDRPDADKTPFGDWFWDECWTPDEHKALAFYETIFGFTHDSMDMGPMGTYYILKKDGMPRAGLAKSVEPKAKPLWLPYVAVRDCDATAARAKSLGGEVVTPPRDIPQVGRFAIAVDTTGAAIAFITPGSV